MAGRRKGTYIVGYTVTIDRPEKRDPSYPKVPAGTKVRHDLKFGTRSAALAEFEGILDGRYDTAGELATSVDVTFVDKAGKRSQVRTPTNRRRVNGVKLSRVPKRRKPTPRKLKTVPADKWPKVGSIVKHRGEFAVVMENFEVDGKHRSWLKFYNDKTTGPRDVVKLGLVRGSLVSTPGKGEIAKYDGPGAVLPTLPDEARPEPPKKAAPPPETTRVEPGKLFAPEAEGFALTAPAGRMTVGTGPGVGTQQELVSRQVSAEKLAEMAERERAERAAARQPATPAKAPLLERAPEPEAGAPPEDELGEARLEYVDVATGAQRPGASSPTSRASPSRLTAKASSGSASRATHASGATATTSPIP